MTGEFLLEIGTEEIPAGFVIPALETLQSLFVRSMSGARVAHGSVNTYATPRRLILRASGVASHQASVEIEKTGPPREAAFDKNGQPTKAAIGFAKSQGVLVEDLVFVQTSRGEQVGVRRLEKGCPTREALSDVLPALIEKIPFPKTMRWMDLDVRFVRPIHWILALFEGDVVSFGLGNIDSSNVSRGHRFCGQGNVKITCFDDLQKELGKDGILIDFVQRRSVIESQISALAYQKGLRVFEDPTLLDEVNFLVESPYAVMGEFASDFLELPASILITCMKKHQRYFSVQGPDGRISNHFIAVNNTPVRDASVSVKGHQRVLKARLEDARFYYREDRKKPLFSRLDALKGVVFHSRLGTAFEKVQRFTQLAKKIAVQFCPERIQTVERAALLCKCDLETGIVYEFPELQGIIGSYYAKKDGEAEDVAIAVREHYLPAYSGDGLPRGLVGAIVSIADRIDTVTGCFSVGLVPTGTADPYALRRHAIAIIQILIDLGRPLNLNWLIEESVFLLENRRTRPEIEILNEVIDFIMTRFVNFHTSRDFSLDVVEAAVRVRFDDIVDARKRVQALQQWKTREDFDAVMTGFKRAANILKEFETSPVSPELFQDDAEKVLFSTFVAVSGRCLPLIESGDYPRALEVMAELRTPIDTFFDRVMVMVDDASLRENRLGLLHELVALFRSVADFSLIGSTAQNS